MSEWRKAKACSGNSACVEVMRDGRFVYLRSGGGRRTLTMYEDEWTAFVEGVKAGDFDQ